MASLAAVVVTYRTGPRLFACLDAIAGAPEIDRVVVVDNGNPQNVRARLHMTASKDEDFVYLTGHGNIGFAAGCNLGVRAARRDCLLFINPDAVLAPGAVAALLDAHRGRPALCIIGGRIAGLDGAEQRGCRRGELTMLSAFADMTGLSRFSDRWPALASTHYEREPPPEGPTPMGAVSGAFMMISAADFGSLGGFDEGYFLHVEDIDICRRARDAGGEVVFVPAAVAEHEGATSDAGGLFVAWCKGRGLARYFRKFAKGPFSFALALALTPVIVAAASGRALRPPPRGRGSNTT